MAIQKIRKISFVDNKINQMAVVCTCGEMNLYSCVVHDGSCHKNKLYFNLIKNYYAKYETFNEKDVLSYTASDYDLISYYLHNTINLCARLESRKQERFKEHLTSIIEKRLTPIIEKRLTPIIEDTEWVKFIARWDNSFLDIISAKKQQSQIKVPIIRGGARDFNGDISYSNMYLIQKLVGILENAQELVSMDVVMV